jgi:radical SAM protein with 4Fe4S-binding SPASM domain
MIEYIARKAAKLGAERVVLELPLPGNDFEKTCPMYSHAAYYIERAATAEIPVTVRNIPPCFLKDARDHLECAPPGTKKESCNWCLLECQGLPDTYARLFGRSELLEHTPNELKIELTDGCNLACGFCYRKGRGKGKPLTAEDHIKLLDTLQGLVRTVRFTGGEPLLSKHARAAIAHAKKKGFKIIINTNGTIPLPEEAFLADDILMPLHGYDEEDERKKTGKRLFLQKLRQIKRNNDRITVNTLATRRNIRDFDKFLTIIRQIRPKHWFWTIPEPVNGSRGMGKADVQRLVEHIRKSKMPITISQAIPFCSIQDESALGKLYNGANLCGPWTSIHLDAFGNIRSCYMGKSYGNVRNTDLRMAWKSIRAELDSMTLPKRCRTCSLIAVCRGGCSLLVKERGRDPLMRK